MSEEVPETFGSSISLFEYEMGDTEEWPTPDESVKYYTLRRHRCKERRQRYSQWRQCGLSQ